MQAVQQKYVLQVEVGQARLAEVVSTALDAAFLASGQWGPLSALPAAKEATMVSAVAAANGAFARLREALARFDRSMPTRCSHISPHAWTRLDELVVEAQRMVQPASPIQTRAAVDHMVADLAKRRKIVDDLEAQRADPLVLHKYQAYQDFWRLASVLE
jgi:hypothetical protein